MKARLQIEPRTKAERAALGCKGINLFELLAKDLPQIDYPVKHTFVPKNGGLASGLYVREVTLPKDAFFTTKIHRTEHPFVISKGAVAVWTEEDGWEVMRAPHSGVTKPLTRRFIMTLETTIWTTFHATNETDLEKIEATLILPHGPEIAAPPFNRLSR